MIHSTDGLSSPPNWANTKRSGCEFVGGWSWYKSTLSEVWYCGWSIVPSPQWVVESTSVLWMIHSTEWKKKDWAASLLVVQINFVVVGGLVVLTSCWQITQLQLEPSSWSWSLVRIIRANDLFPTVRDHPLQSFPEYLELRRCQSLHSA